jgi:hypothetical protein
MATTIYATMACPYAHRVLLSLALRPIKGSTIVTSMPTLNQLLFVQNWGPVRGDLMGNLGGRSHAELVAAKENYKERVISSGVTPALDTPSGVLYESDVLCEYIDAASTATDGPRLLPADPFLASKVKLSINKFNGVPGTIVKLLKNQDPSMDTEMATAVDVALEAFAATLDDGMWCHGPACSLADVHCGRSPVIALQSHC